MSEFKRVLDSAAARATIAGDPFEELERRRRRKDRRRRIQAGVVALSVAIAGIGGVVVAFDKVGPAPGSGAAGDDSFLGAVWPEQTLEEAQATQTAADAGDPSLAWRLDPKQVAAGFVTDVLGWEPAWIDTGVTPGPAGQWVAEVARPAVPCPTPAEGEPVDLACVARQATLTLEQPLSTGEGAIWSVASVGSNVIDLGAAAPVAGEQRTVTIEAPDGATGWVGVADVGGACEVTPPNAPSLDVVLPGADSGCTDGTYLYALVRPAAEVAEPPVPFDGLETIALAMVPVSPPVTDLTPPPSPSPVESPQPQDEPHGANIPDVLHVTCTSQGMELGSTEVQPQSDGVHIQIESPEGHQGAWHATLLDRDDGRFDTFTQGLGDPGTTAVVFTFPPGPIFVNCFLGDSFNAGKVQTRDKLVKIEVVDPNGMWVSDRLACEQPVNAFGFRADAGATSPDEVDPEQAIRLHVPGVLDTDEVVPAEYGVRDAVAWMIVRRGEENLARFQVTGADGQWGVHFGDTCPGSGIAAG